MAMWEDAQRQAANKSSLNFRIVYRIKLFLSREEQYLSPDALNLYFIQGIYDVVHANYPCSEKDALTLAACAVQGTFGSNDPSFYSNGFLANKLAQFVPKDIITRRDHTYIDAKILQEHAAFQHMNKTEARKKYLEIIKKWPIYGASFFKVVQVARVQAKVTTEDLILAISERGAILCDPTTREVRKAIELPEIVTYGYKDKSFLLVVGNMVQQKKLTFQTPQGKQINDLILTYINKLVAAQQTN
eukprot:TRINITY_DN5824_c0_g1_i2.p1 TRINITY_DN5824_c0_g1~~TRINITY_DN5824_c0_g1_i2.p1  ORF type:complete len:245 (-),score=82.63 TRINITY_DN5824_c0_g1_i2:176-910(-)